MHDKCTATVTDFSKVAVPKMVVSVCNYSKTSQFNGIPVSVIARILDFNNGVECYQTVNTLITVLCFDCLTTQSFIAVYSAWCHTGGTFIPLQITARASG